MGAARCMAGEPRCTSCSPWACRRSSNCFLITSPGWSDGIWNSTLRVVSTQASASVASRMSRSSAVMVASQAINSCVLQLSSLSLRYSHCTSSIRWSSIGVAQL